MSPTRESIRYATAVWHYPPRRGPVARFLINLLRLLAWRLVG